MYSIAVVPGDGIGREVIPQAVRVLRNTGLDFKFQHVEVGYDTFKKRGTPLPEEAISEINANQACLFGATTTPVGINDYQSAIVLLRKALDVYANVRPIKSYSVPKSRDGLDMVIVRENTEGLYSGIEIGMEDLALTFRVITKRASERIARFAFKLASKRRRMVTIVTKANIMKKTCGLFREACLRIAKEYPHVEVNELLVDAMAMNLIRKPQDYDVILTTNMFGDILSDEAAALVGGLGIVPSANIGADFALFEPVHGSAPDIAGKGIANPLAAILSSKLLLEYLGEERWAQRVDNAVESLLKEGMSLTPDMGGDSTTIELTDAVIENL